MAKPKTAAAPATAADLIHMSPEEFDQQCKAVIAFVKQCLALLPAIALLTRDERSASIGKVGVDELPELVLLLDVVDASPAIFGALAARDHGTDPRKVETVPTRQAIAVLRSLGPVIKAVKELATVLSDTRLRVGEPVRELTTAVRAVAKANAPIDAAVRAGMAKVDAKRAERLAAKKKTKKKTTKTPA